MDVNFEKQFSSPANIPNPGNRGMGTGDVLIPMRLSYSAGTMRVEIATNAFAHADVDAKELRHESTTADRRILAM